MSTLSVLCYLRKPRLWQLSLLIHVLVYMKNQALMGCELGIEFALQSSFSQFVQSWQKWQFCIQQQKKVTSSGV